MVEIMIITINAVLIQNFVMVQFLGICSFLGVSKKFDTALGMGMAVTFTMTMASALTWVVNKFILGPLNIDFMQTVTFILIIAALVQVVEIVLQKMLPSLYNALGIYLPLITTNCAVLGVAILNIQRDYNFINSVVFGFTAAVGFTLAIVIFSAVRERIALANIPKAFEGLPITLIAAGLMSMVFMAFQGLKIGF